MSFAQIIETTVPTMSAMQGVVGHAGFHDCIFGSQRSAKFTPEYAAALALNSMSAKTMRTIKLRNILAWFYGCAKWNFNNGPALTNAKLRSGQEINGFKVLRNNPGEIVLGLDEKHLYTRISIFRAKSGFTVSTYIKPRTKKGQSFLDNAGEMHKGIARSMLENIVFT